MSAVVRTSKGYRLGARPRSTRRDSLEKACLQRYVRNLVGKVPMTPEFLSLILSLVPRREVRSMLRLVLKGENLKKAMKFSGSVSRLADRVINTISEEECRTDSSAFETRLCEILEKSVNPPPFERLLDSEARLQELVCVMKLQPEEIDIICMVYCFEKDRIFRDFCETHEAMGFVGVAAAALNLPTRRVKTILSMEGKLNNFGIMADFSGRCDHPTLNENFINYLHGVGPEAFIDRFCSRDRGRRLKTARLAVEPRSVETVRRLLETDEPCNILLYGEPGTGKTEFARSIAAESGKQAWFVSNSLYGDHTVSDKKLSLVTSGFIVAENGGVLIVDEADSFLNTRYAMFSSDRRPDKGWLNEFLDRSRAKIIWITNFSCHIEESTMRRFAYSLHFTKFSRKERSAVWKQMLRNHPLRKHIGADAVRELSARYRVNAGGIASSLETAGKIIEPEDATPEAVKSTLRDLLRRHAEAVGAQAEGRLNGPVKHYDVDALHIDADACEIRNSLLSYQAYRREHGREADGNLNLLFWGPPGTGKTEFAKYLAGEINADLLTRRASDLISCWVGETEKNIRKAFAEAEKDGAILFIDEADSFFTDRRNAVRSWETTQTNEMLTQMENFKGVLICCTNLLESLDGAVMRRFPWKVRFMELTPKARVRVYRRFFAVRGELPGEQARRLEAIEGLTLGDYRAVQERFKFIPAGGLKHETLIDALEDEVRYRNGDRKPIGFKG